MASKKRNLILLIVNLFIVLSTIVTVTRGIAGGAGAGQVGIGMVGLKLLTAFTIESNILAAFASFVMATFAADNLIRKRDELPSWAVTFQYISAVAVGLTCLTCVFFLGPVTAMKGGSFLEFFSGNMLFLHLLNPLCAVFSLLLPERGTPLPKYAVWLGMIPTVLYSLIYGFNVLVTHAWDDFYGFTFGGKLALVPVSYLAMYGATLLIGWALKKWHGKN